MHRISASIVLYNTKLSDLQTVIKSYNPSKEKSLYIIDNSPLRTELGEILNNNNIKYFYTGKNLGYGSAHNIAIKQAILEGAEYHAVLNPDISFESSVIDILAKVMDENPSIAHLMPKILNQNGELQYLCKLIPSPIDLIFKRFLPSCFTAKRSEKFQLKFADYNKQMDVPYLSGCFMFLRISALKEVGLFDERFFMYPEDIDLTRRIHAKYRTVYYPDVSIVHAHAAESYKSKKMLKIHIQNMVKYFNKWGWIFDSERRRVNKQILKDLNFYK